MPTTVDGSTASRTWLPWRSAWLAWGVAAAALVVGVPMFLRMPPWCDLTLYDIAAKNILRGGVHYRDVFDTNLPGFVWILCGVRSVFGWSSEAVRLVDLGIVAVVVLLTDRLARSGGASRASRTWAVAGAALFYPFTSEFNHCQRDVWMMLPALAAVVLRARRLVAAPGSNRSVLRAAFLEGLLWALAVWIKPHVMIPAAAVWLVTARRVTRTGWWSLAADFLGNLSAGLIVGALGLAYLAGSGTWPHFVEVFEFWNQDYLAVMWIELDARAITHFHYFVPWCYLQVVSLPLAVLAVIDGQPWRRETGGRPGPIGRVLPGWLWDPGESEAVRFWRMVFATLYLAWTAQAFLVQRGFHYVHVPEILLLLGFLATQRGFLGGFSMFAWHLVTSLIVLAGGCPDQTPERGRVMVSQEYAWVVLHPAADAGRMEWWTACWRTDLSERERLRRHDKLAMVRGFSSAVEWEQLGEVAEYLRAQNVRDREVVGWHDSPHAIVLLLNTQPGFRFQHVSHMRVIGDAQNLRVLWEFCQRAPNVRFVVSDLLRVHIDDGMLPDITDPGPAVPSEEFPALIPVTMHPDVRLQFPYDQAAVFRTRNRRGRYIVHAIKLPVGECAIFDE